MRESVFALILQLGGILVLMIEIIIPSFGILTVVALVLLAYSWVVIVNNMNPAQIAIFATADLIALPICLYIGIKFFKYSPLTHKNVLKRGSALSSDDQANSLLGKKGVVESQLKPVGKALIEGKLIEVSSEGDVLDKDTPIVVVQVNGMKVTVEPINN